jgi:hypothetical protein
MASPTLITINGDINPALEATEVIFRIPKGVAPRHNSGPDVIVPLTEYRTLVNLDGTFTIEVPASNDPNWSPTNWTYEVQVIGDNLNWTFDAQVPVDVTPLNFSTLLPAQSASLGTLYAAVNHTHDGGGGGGAGASPSGTVVATTAFGAASTAGASANYSRGDHSHGTPAAPTAASIGAATSGHNHSGTYDPAGTATAAVNAHAGASDPHPGYTTAVELSTALADKPDIRVWNGSAYVISTTADIYIGPNDPGAMPEGSQWIDTTP